MTTGYGDLLEHAALITKLTVVCGIFLCVAVMWGFVDVFVPPSSPVASTLAARRKRVEDLLSLRVVDAEAQSRGRRTSKMTASAHFDHQGEGDDDRWVAEADWDKIVPFYEHQEEKV